MDTVAWEHGIGVTTPMPVMQGHGHTFLRKTRFQRIRAWIDDQARLAPARLALAVFASIIAIVTALLSLPFASATERPLPFV
ncbi:MAG: hypothetical protein CSA82_03885, partial [Actinobacteria bacterium]